MIPPQKQQRIITTWLYAGVVLIIIQVLLGGITRLTGSGLSITEWKPIVGALPPLNETEWQNAFAKYQQIAQYKYLNADFDIQDFKAIFFWEWLHRNWARVIGLVFFMPFIYFIAQKFIDKKNTNKFLLLFFVGALQGLVGWIMVASGLNQENLYVNHIKLAIHFITALVALVVVYWYALEWQTQHKSAPKYNGRIQVKYIYSILFLLLVQLSYGAFMAGQKAAGAAPTWPSINGQWVPESLQSASLIGNATNIHFIHRNLAYILALAILGFGLLYKKYMKQSDTKWVFAAPVFLVILQIMFGIFTVLTAGKPLRNAMGVFEWNAQIHQIIALFLLLSLIKLLFISKKINSQNEGL